MINILGRLFFLLGAGGAELVCDYKSMELSVYFLEI